MPINYKEYHPEWKKISKQVIEEAGHKCELCGAPNGVEIYRPKKDFPDYRMWYLWGEIIEIIEHYYCVKIVLTVHHIDLNKNNNARLNLIALCQKCHLRLDRAKHIETRKNKKQKNQLKLFENYNTAAKKNLIKNGTHLSFKRFASGKKELKS